MKKIFSALLVACLSFALSAFASNEKVLVVVPNTFIRDAIVLALQLEDYHFIKAESCEGIDAESGQIETLIHSFKPDFVIVDGASENVLDSLLIDTHVINASYQAGVKKVIVLASFDVYPPKSPLPFKEDRLLSVKLENLDDPYRIAKITALQTCHAYNGLKRPRFLFCPYPYLVGPHDTGFDIRSPHPLKNIASRILKAKWLNKDFAVISNDGKARYEFMHVDDMAQAAVFLLKAAPEDEVINVSYGRDTKIEPLAEYVKQHLKFKGNLIFDVTSYDEVARMVLDNSRMTALGWTATTTGQDAIKETVLWLERQAPPPSLLLEEEKFALP